MNYFQRFAIWLGKLAKVTPVSVGKVDDGLMPVSAGGPLDRDYGTLLQEFTDAREAWRKNPIARRLIGLVSAYVVGGNGINVTSKKKAVARYAAEFYRHPENQILLRQNEWSNELSRAGELFLVLHMNQVNGMPYVRAVPASEIQKIDWREGDYEAETYYYERRGPGQTPQKWRSWRADGDENEEKPIMLHYAVNRPVGNIRGESDLSPILPWLQRYSRWLDDRVRMNAAMRVYLWMVRAPKARLGALAEKYKRPPESGSILFVDRDTEEWQAVAPSLQAADAEKDGRAIRWMIVAGGPGTSLVDIGESETANRSTAESMSEQRRRFLRQRQAFFAWVMADLVVQGWNWGVRLGTRRGKQISVTDLIIEIPDVAPADNEALAVAAKEIGGAMMEMRDIVGDSKELREMTARLIMKFAGEQLSDEQVKALIDGAESGDVAEAMEMAGSNGTFKALEVIHDR